MCPLPYSFSSGLARGNPVTPPSAHKAAAGRVLYPLPCSSFEVPGLRSLLSEGISSAPPAAAGPRQGHLSGEWSLNNTLQTHPHWAIVGPATLALALVLEMVVTTERRSFRILESPMRRPSRGFGLGSLPLSFVFGLALPTGFLPVGLANGRPPFALLRLPRPFLFPLERLMNDPFIHLTHPEKTVFFDLSHGLFKGQARVHQLMHFSPCIPFRIEKGLI